MLLKWSSYRLIMSSTVFPDFIPLWLGASFFFNPAHPNRFEPNEVEKTLFSLFYEETAETTIWWNVNINLQSVHFYEQVQNKWAVFMGLTSVSSMLLSLKFQLLLFKISIDRLQPLLKTSSNDMASLCKLTEPERNGLAHLVSPNFKYTPLLLCLNHKTFSYH